MDNLKFITTWYKSHCNGDWEHYYGIKIETLDNPGWAIIIDLTETELENLQHEQIENINEENWWSIITKDKQLIATGDINKLELLLYELRCLLDSNSVS